MAEVGETSIAAALRTWVQRDPDRAAITEIVLDGVIRRERTITRGELVLGPVRVGAMQLLQLEGDGAPHLGPWAFIEEHFTRGAASASQTDSSNRRVGPGVAGQPSFPRLSYAVDCGRWARAVAAGLGFGAGDEARRGAGGASAPCGASCGADRVSPPAREASSARYFPGRSCVRSSYGVILT